MANVPIRYVIMINVAVMPTVRNVYFILQILLLVRIALYLVMMINIYLCMFFASFFQKHSGGKVELAVGRTFERMGFQFDICKSRKKINLLPAYLFRVVQLLVHSGSCPCVPRILTVLGVDCFSPTPLIKFERIDLYGKT